MVVVLAMGSVIDGYRILTNGGACMIVTVEVLRLAVMVINVLDDGSVALVIVVGDRKGMLSVEAMIIVVVEKWK